MMKGPWRNNSCDNSCTLFLTAAPIAASMPLAVRTTVSAVHAIAPYLTAPYLVMNRQLECFIQAAERASGSLGCAFIGINFAYPLILQRRSTFDIGAIQTLQG